MAQNWQSDAYKSQVAARGGSWDSGGAAVTKNTWGTEQVDPSQWQSGGWYTNPNTGFVERWWADGSGGAGGGGAKQAVSSFNAGNNGGGGAAEGGFEAKLPQRPTIDLAKEYNTLYDSLGLKGYKEAVEAKQQEILALRDQTDQAAALINENPWSSAANRTGRLAKLEEAYDRKANVLAAQAALEQQKYADAYNELNTQMNLKTQQYNIDTNNFDWSINQLNSLLSLGALDNASSESLGNIAAQTGMSGDMISSMVKASKNSRMNPTLLQNTDDWGNVTLTLIDANTGNIINQQTLEGVASSNMLQMASRSTGRSGGGSGGGSSSSLNKEINNLLSYRKSAKDAGMDTSYYDTQLAMYGVYPDANGNVSDASGDDLTSFEQDALNAAKRLLQDNRYTAITGWGNVLVNDKIQSGKYNAILADYDALVNNWKIGKSKGLSGSKSDKDMESLEKTIGLNRDMSNDEFGKRLQEIVYELESKVDTNPNYSSYMNAYDINNSLSSGYYINNYW